MTLVAKIVAVYLEHYKENINNLRGKTAEFFGVQSGSTLGFTWLILRMKTLY
jgi:hypothetical protein